MKCTFLIVSAALALPAAAAAQDPTATPTPMRRTTPTPTPQVPPTRIPMQSRIVPGAPYSAETVTESIQVLGDGNRIARKTTIRAYRDTDGRTRVEQVDTKAGDVSQVNISDPVAGATYVLYPRTRTGYHTGLVIATPSGFGSASIEPGGRGVISATRTPDGGVAMRAERISGSEPTPPATGGGGGAMAGARARSGGAGQRTGAGGAGRGAGAGSAAPSGSDIQREDLGQQMIEGVLATGTRRTTTYPAGSIGNEQPIRAVSEEWYAPELQILVLTRHSDPRTGDTTYRVTNLSRAEPDPSLFTVPADYTIEKTFIRRD